MCDHRYFLRGVSATKQPQVSVPYFPAIKGEVPDHIHTFFTLFRERNQSKMRFGTCFQMGALNGTECLQSCFKVRSEVTTAKTKRNIVNIWMFQTACQRCRFDSNIVTKPVRIWFPACTPDIKLYSLVSLGAPFLNISLQKQLSKFSNIFLKTSCSL